MEFQKNEELEKYMKELADDVKLDVYNLKEKSLMTSSIWCKWLSYLYKEKENASRLAAAKDKVIKKHAASIKPTDSVLRLKAQEKLEDSDDKLKQIKQLAKLTQDNIEYIERALTILSNFGYQIRNATEILKLNER